MKDTPIKCNLNGFSYLPVQTISSNSPEETKRIGQFLSKCLKPGNSFGLIGELGAGKTQLVKGVAIGFGIDENDVVSPSFGLINEYEGDKKLYHVDLYRLESPDEIETLGLTDYLHGDGVVAIEWADRLEMELALLDVLVWIDLLSNNRRRLRFYRREHFPFAFNKKIAPF